MIDTSVGLQMAFVLTFRINIFLSVSSFFQTKAKKGYWVSNHRKT